MSTPKPISSFTEVKDAAELIGSLLNIDELAKAAQTSKATLLQFSDQLAEMKLLKAVLEADPKQVKEILAKQIDKSKCIALVKTRAKETYFIEREQKIKCRREWKNISPLEAAAWCGDIFLVKELLKYVPKNDYPEALNQLKDMLERKETAENGGFLAPFINLLKAYQDYYSPEINGYSKQILEPSRKLQLCQLMLPMYGLQEFCDPTHFLPKPTFTEEPVRSCRNTSQSLDQESDHDQESDDDESEPSAKAYECLENWNLGGILRYMPADSWMSQGVWSFSVESVSMGGGYGGLMRHEDNGEKEAFRQLCEVRTQDLKDVIKELERLVSEKEVQSKPLIREQNLSQECMHIFKF